MNLFCCHCPESTYSLSAMQRVLCQVGTDDLHHFTSASAMLGPYETFLFLNLSGLSHKLKKINLKMETLSLLSKTTQL